MSEARKLQNSAVVEGEWMSLAAAADASGYSLATLRRYVKAHRLRSRRQTRASNSKVEVFLPKEFLLANFVSDETERVSLDGMDDILEPTHETEERTESIEAESPTSETHVFIDEEEESDDDGLFDPPAQADPATRETLNWMRSKLDEKDEMIKKLSNELMSASYRNGYLESTVTEYKEQLKLLTDRTKEVTVIEEAPSVTPEPEPMAPPASESGFWKNFGKWMRGDK